MIFIDCFGRRTLYIDMPFHKPCWGICYTLKCTPVTSTCVKIIVIVVPKIQRCKEIWFVWMIFITNSSNFSCITRRIIFITFVSKYCNQVSITFLLSYYSFSNIFLSLSIFFSQRFFDMFYSNNLTKYKVYLLSLLIRWYHRMLTESHISVSCERQGVYKKVHMQLP